MYWSTSKSIDIARFVLFQVVHQTFIKILIYINILNIYYDDHKIRNICILYILIQIKIRHICMLYEKYVTVNMLF